MAAGIRSSPLISTAERSLLVSTSRLRGDRDTCLPARLNRSYIHLISTTRPREKLTLLSGPSICPLVDLAVRYSNPPVRLEALLSRLPTWVRVNRPTHTDHVPVLHEQRLGRTVIDELIADYQTGATKHELAKRYKIGRTNVYDLLRRYKFENNG